MKLNYTKTKIFEKRKINPEISKNKIRFQIYDKKNNLKFQELNKRNKNSHQQKKL